jgi:5-(carboxyamino)imidazole ribonucleotide mutase
MVTDDRFSPIPAPLVGVIMGSDSDLPTMQEAIAVLEIFQISHEVAIVSAHRTPEKMFEYAKTAQIRGLKVIIAGAGGAAHLPGMVASLTPLPVIGVPVVTRTLQGVDSLYSIVQMPAGIPVATVAIGNAKNAGLLAVQILATSDASLLAQVSAYRQSLTDSVLEKQANLEKLGYQDYLDVKD